MKASSLPHPQHISWTTSNMEYHFVMMQIRFQKNNVMNCPPHSSLPPMSGSPQQMTLWSASSAANAPPVAAISWTFCSCSNTLQSPPRMASPQVTTAALLKTAKAEAVELSWAVWARAVRVSPELTFFWGGFGGLALGPKKRDWFLYIFVVDVLDYDGLWK